MKRLFAAVLATLALSVSLFAQSDELSSEVQSLPAKGYPYPLNEFSIGYGYGTFPQIVTVLGGVFGTAFTGGLASVDKCIGVGSFGLEYMRYVHPHVAVGANVGYEATFLSFKNKDGESQESHWAHFVSVMPAIKFPWFSYDHVRMYSKLALGLMCECTAAYDTTDSEGNVTTTPAEVDPNFAFQVVPVGIDFGGERFRGFVESGFGYTGAINFGFRVGF